MAYSDYIKPILYEETSNFMKCPNYHIHHISENQKFQILRRQSLFLGLSDGARIDLFRRVNKDEEIKHDQISLGYDISKRRSEDLLGELNKDLTEIISNKPSSDDLLFKNLFLIDDFSASGKSYLRINNGKLEGKIAHVINAINKSDEALSKIVDKNNLLVCILLYVATEQSLSYLTELIDRIKRDSKYRFKILCIQKITNQMRIQADNEFDRKFLALIEKYYDPGVESPATKIGGTDDIKYGFASCSLPVVMYHNTPNNSVALLWSHEELSIKGLFPRVTRH